MSRLCVRTRAEPVNKRREKASIRLLSFLSSTYRHDDDKKAEAYCISYRNLIDNTNTGEQTELASALEMSSAKVVRSYHRHRRHQTRHHYREQR